ncbi:Bug family tripartite tricarboxylate transporter substrate binding protein [Humitalea sp. 24SJ18S-53]|uniref:Bug family tripartite tricarboxylate transporter substrate binding protein n=1 Tax=Humitalea sp. 24SJ18S-53 TaxID=3422307 RepID=UPI003D6724D7
MARRRDIILGAAAMAVLGRVAAAADFPDRPIRIVVPFPPGGNLDFTARLLAPPMAQILGQPVIVDNRAGAGGVVGTEAVARARPDGTTLLMGSSGPLSLLPATMPSLPFNPLRDFAPVGPAYRIPIVVLAGRGTPATTLAELVALAKVRAGAITAGTSGIGTGAHLAVELFNNGSGATLLHVPYRGTGPAISDLIAGNVATVFDQLSTALPLHADGRARILAIGSAERSPLLPDVPTFREAGLVQPELTTTLGLLAPAGTPPAVIEILRAALAATLADPAMRGRLQALGAEVASGDEVSPRHYAALIADELETSRRAVALPGVKLE